MCFSKAMAAPIEDYALLSDLQTGPLISRNGSIDWLCFPRFDSPSLFSSLVGVESHGRWLLTPRHSEAAVVKRHYVDSTFVLETVWKTPTGLARVTDFMPVGHTGSSILRRVTGLEGRVEMCQELIIRPRYCTVVPWARRIQDGAAPGGMVLLAMAGPDAVALRGPYLPRPTHMGTRGNSTWRGEKLPTLN